MKPSTLVAMLKWACPPVQEITQDSQYISIDKAELAQLRRDAERWRVARRWPFFQSSLVLVWPIWGPGTAYPEAADVVDSRIDWYINTNRIDAAIAAEGEKK